MGTYSEWIVVVIIKPNKKDFLEEERDKQGQIRQQKKIFGWRTNKSSDKGCHDVLTQAQVHTDERAVNADRDKPED